MPGEATGTPASYRDLPEWQAANAEYLQPADCDGDGDKEFLQRVRAALRLHEIESAFPSGS